MRLKIFAIIITVWFLFGTFNYGFVLAFAQHDWSTPAWAFIGCEEDKEAASIAFFGGPVFTWIAFLMALDPETNMFEYGFQYECSFYKPCRTYESDGLCDVADFLQGQGYRAECCYVEGLCCGGS